MNEQEQVVQEQEQEVVDVAKLIEDLTAQGLEEEQILESLKKMVEEGKLSEEDLAKGQEILGQKEKADAEALFGTKII